METNIRIREEYITAYDMRGPWASEEAKQEIREQINDKIDELLKSQKEEAKREEREIIISLMPNEQTHTLPDGVNSPHETEYDFGWNSYRGVLLNLIKEEEKETLTE